MNGNLTKSSINKSLRDLQSRAIGNGVNVVLLNQYNYICNYNVTVEQQKSSKKIVIFVVVFIFLLLTVSSNVVDSFLSARCLFPSNYLIWEATRPLADCNYCINVTKPVVLRNITRREFAKYAYSSRPIIVKNAISHWRATKEFNFHLFKRLYEQTEGSYESLEDGCQFLNFKTDLYSLKEVFDMPEKRARNAAGEQPWYVGWGNCHPDILAKVRKYYSIPEFLPEDAEFAATENIFFGYEMGAVMHLDYIPRLMWQGQVSGNKTWAIAPVPECDSVCHKFQYYVEPGDVVLLDTRIWYHATSLPKGQFSLTVQSEYG
ncbi:hypothetical protein JYU34_021013 [Plutella xylostella]|uniref:Uncharacterized protein n=1 Tax=Plutella xylostella TaxID=51655 RepID=A0ABQ7PT12_PLUXY|nr:hypothetical protein JYU34_021013 [Plutella xylostella]